MRTTGLACTRSGAWAREEMIDDDNQIMYIIDTQVIKSIDVY